MVKNLYFLLIIWLVFSVIGCGNTNTTTTSTSISSETKKTTTISTTTTTTTTTTTSTTITENITTTAEITPNRIHFNNGNWFLLGVNYPWINYGHDFGDTAWGHNGVTAVLNGGWQPQTYQNSQGISKVIRSDEYSYNKSGHSLKLFTTLEGNSSNNSKGEVFVDLRYHTPSGMNKPSNWDGITLECWIYAPPGSGGDGDSPNGLQIFIKDSQWRNEYGPWVNIEEGRWNKVSLKVSSQTPTSGVMDQGFDPIDINLLGIKAAIGSKSSSSFEGAFFLDKFTVDNIVWFDFENKSEVEKDFEVMKGCGIKVVRWFVFADGRAAPEFDNNGTVIGFDKHFFEDFDAALEAARNNDIYLIPVLFDFHLCDNVTTEDNVQLGGHDDLIYDSVKTQSFVENALNPLLERYKNNENILAWDIINEPEWAMDIEGVTHERQLVSKEAMQNFVTIIAKQIKEISPQTLITLGCASRKWLDLWNNVGLDFYQYHYYDKFEKETPFDTLYDIFYKELKLDKPCILGEFSTNNSIIDIQTYLEKSLSNNLAGALAWSYRAKDNYSIFSSEPFLTWRKMHEAIPIDIH